MRAKQSQLDEAYKKRELLLKKIEDVEQEIKRRGQDGWLDPENSDDAYSPSEVTVEVGTTVTWTNEDSVLHTVTSGTKR